jgi:hypothetical protein
MPCTIPEPANIADRYRSRIVSDLDAISCADPNPVPAFPAQVSAVARLDIPTRPDHFVAPLHQQRHVRSVVPVINDHDFSARTLRERQTRRQDQRQRHHSKKLEQSRTHFKTLLKKQACMVSKKRIGSSAVPQLLHSIIFLG